MVKPMTPDLWEYKLAQDHMQEKLIDGKLDRIAYVRWKGHAPSEVTCAFYDIEGEDADREAARYENEMTKHW